MTNRNEITSAISPLLCDHPT